MAKESGNPTGAAEGKPSVKWDDSNMRSLYSNVVNVAGTREEIVLLFGTHQAWHSDVKEVIVQLLERIVLNPYAAKRLNALLTMVLREYESRYGALKLEGLDQLRPAETLPVRSSIAIPPAKETPARENAAATGKAGSGK